MQELSQGRALILVRNPVTRDARILREADTLARLGFEVLIAGVVATDEPERRLVVEGKPVLRLDPAGAIRKIVRIRRGSAARAPAQGGAPARAEHAVRTRDERASRLRRLAVTIAYYLQGIALVRRTVPVLVHANDYNTMWIGVAAKLLLRSWLVYDCHELWPDRNQRPEWRPWLLACEAFFVRFADATITTSPGYAEALAERYHVWPPSVVRNIPAQPASPRGRTSRPSSGDPLAVYVGGLMPGRGLEPAISALSLADELRLRLVGPGTEAYRAHLQQCADDAGVSGRVEFAPPVSPGAVLDAIADASLGLMLIEPVCRSYELTVPNKLFEYAAAALPILSSNLPVIGPLIRAEGLGEVVPPDDIQLIAHAMRRLADPVASREVRERVQAFARRVTWERERTILERVYDRRQPRARHG